MQVVSSHAEYACVLITTTNFLDRHLNTTQPPPFFVTHLPSMLGLHSPTDDPRAALCVRLVTFFCFEEKNDTL